MHAPLRRIVPGAECAVLFIHGINATPRFFDEYAEALPADQLVSLHSLVVGVGSADLLQDFIVVALDAQADTIESLISQLPQQTLVDRVGICLEGDLRSGRHIKALANSGKNGRHTIRAEKAGGTAAKINGIHQISRGLLTGFLDMGADGFSVLVHQLAVPICQGVKIAIDAFTPAERHMNIDSQGFLVFTGKKGHVCLLIKISPSPYIRDLEKERLHVCK